MGWGALEAAKIFSQTSASACENRSRKILAVACEQNDITAALNIYAIKGCHQLRTQLRRFFSFPVLIFLGCGFRKWAGLSSYRRRLGAAASCLLCRGRGSLRQSVGRAWGEHTLELPGEVPHSPGSRETLDLEESPRTVPGSRAGERPERPPSPRALPLRSLPRELLKGQEAPRPWHSVHQDVFCRVLT